MITGKTLIDWGLEPGPGFAGLLKKAQEAAETGSTEEQVRELLKGYVSPVRSKMAMKNFGPNFHINMDTPQNDGERQNQASVIAHMRELMRVPTIVAGAVMPDACPSDTRAGTIPVGGVVAAKNAIHPGMHSADICCSMAYTDLGDNVDPKTVLDVAQRITHFGPGGRTRGKQWSPPEDIMLQIGGNLFLAPFMSQAIEHFGTQGDGNHFLYVGRRDGRTILVTHHGSRALGAKLYKTGMATANRFRKELSPETPEHNAWIPADSREGQLYWQALQTVRLWTKANHFILHDAIVTHTPGAAIRDRFWNEHNFVFQKTDGLFYHAKGATPAFAGYAVDDVGLTLIPLNMAAPILIARGGNSPLGLGFAPHGAGRNMSRTAYKRSLGEHTIEEILAIQAQGIDARFYNGNPDVTELPLAYKDAARVRSEIEAFGLADIVDEITPYGCIMAGAYDWGRKGRKAAGTA